MNTKRKGEKGKSVIGITLAMIMVASIFAAIVPVTTALDHTIAKHSLDYEGGPVNNTKVFNPGDTVYYLCEYTPNSESVWLNEVRDNYPDGTSKVLFNGNVSISQGTMYTITTNWSIPSNWSASTINNQVLFNITSQLTGLHDSGTASQQNFIKFAPPEFNFSWDWICCRNISFTGSTSKPGEIANHTWDFGDGTILGPTSGDPGTVTHQYSDSRAGTPVIVTLSGYDNKGNKGNYSDFLLLEKDPIAVATASPFCFEANGTWITFDGSGSSADPITGRSLTYSWTFSDGGSGTSDNAVNTSREVNDTLTATLTVDDGHCTGTTNVTVNPCSNCKLRIYGTFDRGAGYLGAIDPVTGLPPENKPYSDPVGPFYPQNDEAPRKDFITFNPAIMDHNQGYDEIRYVPCNDTAYQKGAEKVFKRMWYEKDWFKDHDADGCWDVVIEYENGAIVMENGKPKTMCLEDWYKIPVWERAEKGWRLREWNNNEDLNDSNVDIYGPAIIQEFTYMFVDDEWMPQMVQNGSEVLIPMAHDPANAYSGLNSFDADGDGVRDVLRVESEQTLGLDIDHDGSFEPMGDPFVELDGDETVVLVLGNKYMPQGASIQLFDHVVTLKDVMELGSEGWGIFNVCDNEGGDSKRCTENVQMKEGDVRYFYRAKPGNPSERQTFYLRLISADATDNTAIIEMGRMFGQAYANIGANPYWSQKAFMVDGVFYNVVAIKALDNCAKYITFRQKLPKLPIKLFGKHLKVWKNDTLLPEMSPFNLPHEVVVDVQDIWTWPHSQQDKIGVKEPRPPLEITYVTETIERRYKGELKEIYNESWNPDTGVEYEGWNLEWYWTLPWQYTEFRLPATNQTAEYLVTLSWFAPEAETTLWNSDPNGPVANYTGERFKFWYQDCSGPLYIDANQSSIRLFGTFGMGAGNPWVRDPESIPQGLRPENPPYTDPEGPFDPQHWQAPRKDFMTFNPAMMDHNQGYPELDFAECNTYRVQAPQEKVFKRMWYQKEWFKDHYPDDDCWTVVIDRWDGAKWVYYRTMCLWEWNAIPDWEKFRDGLRIREHNNDEDINDSRVDIYGPAIVQEFAYMFLDEETMPILIGNGSDVLIPMAHDPANAYRGLNSFDADGDGVRDSLRVESEQTLGLDIDHDGILEPMGDPIYELDGDETLVLVLGGKYMNKDGTIQLFDHVVTLKDVMVLGNTGWAVFNVCDNEGGGSQRCTENVQMRVGDVRYFYRAKPGNSAEKETFYLKLVAADGNDKKAIVEMGRMFGQTYANIGTNPYWSQKAFIVDEVFYNVVAIKALDNCVKYIVFRQKLPKMPIKLFGKHLKVWDIGETLPEMSPFNMPHEIIIDVQPTWTHPYSQQDKIGPKEPRPALNITYVEEDVEERFRGQLLEIYNESWNPDTGVEYEYWNLEWFHTYPEQYTAFVMPDDQLYLMTLAWYAPQAEITIWDGNPDKPVANYSYERVKFWYDPADNHDIYINRVGDLPDEPGWITDIAEFYDMASNGGNSDGIINIDEVINAIMDYLTDTHPFGPTGPGAPFNKDGLIDYILDYLALP